jgi:hypothetical protein
MKCNHCKKKRCDCREPVLDMIDESKGYVKGNVRWISKLAQRTKHEWAHLSEEENKLYWERKLATSH